MLSSNTALDAILFSHAHQLCPYTVKCYFCIGMKTVDAEMSIRNDVYKLLNSQTTVGLLSPEYSSIVKLPVAGACMTLLFTSCMPAHTLYTCNL